MSFYTHDASPENNDFASHHLPTYMNPADAQQQPPDHGYNQSTDPIYTQNPNISINYAPHNGYSSHGRQHGSEISHRVADDFGYQFHEERRGSQSPDLQSMDQFLESNLGTEQVLIENESRDEDIDAELDKIPLYRPVEKPINPAAAYQCLVQLEQELSEQCEESQKIDLNDPCLIKFTDVGRQLFQATGTTAYELASSSRNDQSQQSVSVTPDIEISPCTSRSRQTTQESQSQSPTPQNEEIDELLNILSPSHARASTDSAFASSVSEDVQSMSSTASSGSTEFITTDPAVPSPYRYQNYRQSVEPASSRALVPRIRQEGSVLKIGASEPQVFEYRGGNQRCLPGPTDFFDSSSSGTYRLNPPYRKRKSPEHRPRASMGSDVVFRTPTLPVFDNTIYQPIATSIGPQIPRSPNVPDHCQSPGFTSPHMRRGNSDPPTSTLNFESNNALTPQRNRIPENFIIRNTEADYQKAKHDKLVARRRQVNSAIESHKTTIESLEKLLMHQKAKLRHDEQTLKFLDSELQRPGGQ